MVIFTPPALGCSETKFVRNFSSVSWKLKPKLVAWSPLPSLVKEKETWLPGILGIIFLSSSFRSITRESRIPWFPDADGGGGGGGGGADGDGDSDGGGGGGDARDCCSLTELTIGLSSSSLSSSRVSADSSLSLLKLDAG